MKNFENCLCVMEDFEQLRLHIYRDEDARYLRNDDASQHLKTHPRKIKYSDIIAIATKGASLDIRYKSLKRGGALVYVKGRRDPYVTRDDESVKAIIAKLERNPFCCCSGLSQVGSSNIYADSVNYTRSANGTILLKNINVSLELTSFAIRKLNWIANYFKWGKQDSCFFETKNRLRRKYKKV